MKKATFLDILRITFNVHFQKSDLESGSQSAPGKIGSYRLLYEVTKKHSQKRHIVGIYHYQRKKYFIKTWQGSRKDLFYFDLVNEYHANKLLHRKIKQFKINSFSVPRIIACIKRKGQLSVVFEYVTGKSLANQSIAIQTHVIRRILDKLYTLTPSLTRADKSRLKFRPYLFYFMALPIEALHTLVANPRSWYSILVTFIKSYLYTTNNLLAPLILAHRDLTVENIIVTKRGVVVTDTEHMALSLPNDDCTRISLENTLDQVSKRLKCGPQFRENKLLKAFITLQHMRQTHVHTNFIQNMLPQTKLNMHQLNIPDPIGMGMLIYEQVFQGIEKRLKDLWPEIIRLPESI